jgi:transcriptional regulator with XRE-family HTH domain
VEGIEMNYENLGSRIRRERQKHTLTQEKLAEKIDVSHAYIGQIERGERSMSLETLVKLAVQLDVTVDELLSDAIELQDSFYLNKIEQLLKARSIQEQRMVWEMIELMFVHLDKQDNV